MISVIEFNGAKIGFLLLRLKKSEILLSTGACPLCEACRTAVFQSLRNFFKGKILANVIEAEYIFR